jgi:hypothetical protein
VSLINQSLSIGRKAENMAVNVGTFINLRLVNEIIYYGFCSFNDNLKEGNELMRGYWKIKEM